MTFQRMLTSGENEKAIYHLWQRYKQQPFRKLRHIWRLYKLHNEFDLSPPDTSSWTWQFPRGQIPQCSACTDNCCKGPHNTVLLRLVDVARFVDRGWTDRLTLEKPTFDAATLAQKPMLQDTLSSFHWRVFPVLKQHPQHKTCTLLDHQGKCSIHPDRPWICRVFPYHLDLEQQAVGWSPRCKWPREGEAQGPVARELEHAVFHSFFTEKIRDMILLYVYREEIAASPLAAWLDLSAL